MKTKISLIMAIASSIATTGALAEGHLDMDGAVFTMNNSSNANQALVFERQEDGSLSYSGEVPTGGLGTGAGLGSQGGVILSEGHRWLFVVNAGSHEISSFAVSRQGLEFADKVDSGGMNPISSTISGNLLYVLNSGGTIGATDNITGFVVSSRGKLEPVPDSTRGLSGVSNAPAQVGFSADGSVLVVTEKGTSLIDTFVVNDDQTPGDHKTFQSPGTEPFGFAFDRKNHLFVTEAVASTISSYSVSDDGDLSIISQSVPTEQKAACWMAVTKNGQFGYDANAMSNSTSGFRIGRDGSLTLLNANGIAGVTGKGPNDLTFSEDSRFLYTLDSSGGAISVFRVNSNGSLEPLAPAAIPAGSDGVAAY